MNTLRYFVILLATAGVAAQGLQVEAANDERERPAPERILLVAAAPQPGLTIPGITGKLQLDLGTLIAFPRWQGFGPNFNAFLRTLPRSRFACQILTAGPGLHLSELKRVSLGGFAQRDGLATCRERAQKTIDMHRGTAMAPGWEKATLGGPARPLYRPDVSGIAYYEFPVQPAGFIVVATGEHDYPVPHWNFDGNPISTDLETQAGKTPVARIFKLDTLCYVAEDARANRIANIGGLPSRLTPDAQGGYRFGTWRSWQELKTHYLDTYRPLIENLRLAAIEEWEAEELRRSGAIQPLDWSAWRSYFAGSSWQQRLYTQYTYRGCAVGCGAVAWAMLFGWVDVQAARNHATWRRHAGIYRTGGSSNGWAGTVAPRRNDSGVRTMIEEIRRYIGTFCVFGSGATFPWNMRDANKYLSRRVSARVRTNYSRVGIHWDDLRQKASYSITSRKTPAIIGTGWLKHYPLAWGYAYRSKKYGWGWASYTRYQRRFYVNQGWGGSGNGWVGSGTWFAGQIFP